MPVLANKHLELESRLFIFRISSFDILKAGTFLQILLLTVPFFLIEGPTHDMASHDTMAVNKM